MRRTLKRLLLVVAVTVAGLGFVSAPAAHAVVVVVGIQVPEDRWFEIYPPFISPAHPTCLDVPKGTPKSVDTELFSCHGYDSAGGPQRWEFSWRLDTFNRVEGYQLRNTMSGNCLSRWSQSFEIVTQGCEPANIIALWVLEPAPIGPAGSFFVKHEIGGAGCLTADEGTGRNRVRVVFRPCNPGDRLQVWALG